MKASWLSTPLIVGVVLLLGVPPAPVKSVQAEEESTVVFAMPVSPEGIQYAGENVPARQTWRTATLTLAPDGTVVRSVLNSIALPTSQLRQAELAPGTSTKISEDMPDVLFPLPGASEVQLSPTILYNIVLPVAPYWQCSPAWGSNVMQTCGQTICNSGCLLTSASMVFRYYGSHLNPGQVNTCMGTDACPWVHSAGGDRCSEAKATWAGFFSSDYSTLILALSRNEPPILQLTRPGRTHWVVVYAVNGSGLQDSHYRIVDPADGTTKYLTAYTGNGWSKSGISLYVAGPTRLPNR